LSGVSLGDGAAGILTLSRTLIESLSMAFWCTYCSQIMMAQGDPSLQVVESHWAIAIHSWILGDIMDCELAVSCH